MNDGSSSWRSLGGGIPFFFVPFSRGLAVGAAAYLALVDRITRRTTTRAWPLRVPILWHLAAHRPLGPPAHPVLQRLSANLALHERRRNPTLDALRRRRRSCLSYATTEESDSTLS